MGAKSALQKITPYHGNVNFVNPKDMSVPFAR